jgi:hypothetical protein
MTTQSCAAIPVPHELYNEYMTSNTSGYQIQHKTSSRHFVEHHACKRCKRRRGRRREPADVESDWEGRRGPAARRSARWRVLVTWWLWRQANSFDDASQSAITAPDPPQWGFLDHADKRQRPIRPSARWLRRDFLRPRLHHLLAQRPSRTPGLGLAAASRSGRERQSTGGDTV